MVRPLEGASSLFYATRRAGHYCSGKGHGSEQKCVLDTQDVVLFSCAPGHHAVESATANWRGARPTETRSHAPQPYRAFWVETHLRRLFAPSHMHPRNLARASCNLTEGSQKTAIRALFAFSTDGPQLPHANRCEGASDKSGRRFMRLSTDYQHCDFSPGLPGEKCVRKKGTLES